METLNCKQHGKERGGEVGRHCVWSPFQSLSSTCSSAVRITGSCFVLFWVFCCCLFGVIFFSSVFVFEHRKALRMASAWFLVCAVCWGGYNTWVCSRLLEMCCVFFG